MREDPRSPIWGGATFGLIVGLILGFFVGSYWATVLYAVLIGAAIGLLTNVLAAAGVLFEARRRKRLLGHAAPASPYEAAQDSETTQYLFETSEDYRAQSEFLLESLEKLLREINPADFNSQEVEKGIYEMTAMVEDGESWRAEYDSLEAFYVAHEDRHPEIRHYAARHRASDPTLARDLNRPGEGRTMSE